MPVDIYAKGPNQRVMVARMASGDSTTAYDGREAWHAAPHAISLPVSLIPRASR